MRKLCGYSSESYARLYFAVTRLYKATRERERMDIRASVSTGEW